MKTKTIPCFNEECPNTVEVTEEDLARVGEGEVIICSDCFEYISTKIAELREGGTIH